MTIDHTIKPSKAVFNQKNSSSIIFDDRAYPLPHKDRNSIRDPILGENTGGDLDSQRSLIRKKQIEYQPSKVYDTLNKKRYMLPSDMKPLNELY